MFLPSTVQIWCTAWFIEVNLCRILMPFVSGINRQEEYCLFLAWILTSKYQSVVDDRMKIKRTSNVVDMLEESTLNYHIVLQWRINEITSWMTLKSSKVNNCSWSISAVLIYSFYSNCCQTYFSTIVWPMLYLWKLISKIILDLPELNCSVVYSLYRLTVSKKIDCFLRILVRRERRISWFNINRLSFTHRNDAR